MTQEMVSWYRERERERVVCTRHFNIIYMYLGLTPLITGEYIGFVHLPSEATG